MAPFDVSNKSLCRNQECPWHGNDQPTKCPVAFISGRRLSATRAQQRRMPRLDPICVLDAEKTCSCNADKAREFAEGSERVSVSRHQRLFRPPKKSCLVDVSVRPLFVRQTSSRARRPLKRRSFARGWFIVPVIGWSFDLLNVIRRLSPPKLGMRESLAQLIHQVGGMLKRRVRNRKVSSLG